MREVQKNNLKKAIIDSAWELFHEKGYKNTTVHDIIEHSGTSKGGFYYYFRAKDDLLNSLYEIFDTEYERFYSKMDKSQHSLVQLEQVSQYVAYFIEANVTTELLSELYISQLVKKKSDDFLSEDRFYVKMIREIISLGQERGEIRDDIPVNELTHHVLVIERGIFTEWCVQNGAFSLGFKGAQDFSYYIEFMRKQ